MFAPAPERPRRALRPAVCAVGLALVVAATPGVARAVIDGPAPGAASAQTLKLPDGPSSVHGLSEQPTFDVFTAQVSYGVPMELPKAAAGFGPQLSLTYGGDLGNGPVGVAWALSSIAIRRSVRHGVPSYTAADELELTGIGKSGRLRPFAGELRVEGAPTTIRVLQKGGGYEVTDADGTRYLLGYTAAGRETSPDGRVSGWLVQWVVRFGQTIEFQYGQNQGRTYLTDILWGPGQRFHADLTYEDRRDPTISFRAGYQVITAWRLAKVTVTVSGQTLRTYTLTYDDETALGSLSRLQGVTETGTDGVTKMPELAFDYALPEPPQVTEARGADGWVLNDRGTAFADVDGDGMADLLRLEMGNHLYRKNVGGSFEGARPLTGAGQIDLEASRMMDLDGDARPELVYVVDDTWRAYKLEGDQWTFFKEWAGTKLVPLHSPTSAACDVNGDGRLDVIEAQTGGIGVRLAGDEGLGPKLSRGRIDPANVGVDPGNRDVRFLDVNGDGLVDAVWLAEEWFKIYLGRGDGTFLPYKRAFYPWKTLPGADNVFRSSDIQIADLNRDGLVDMVVTNAASVLYFRGLADLGTFGIPRRVGRPEGVAYDAVVTLTDANGNGSDDVVWSSTRGMWILDLAGGTTAGMLSGIHNGLGATTTIAYTYSAALSVEAEKAGRPWERKLPTSIPVPTKLTLDGGGDSPPRVTSYNVRDGFWDGVERRFGGFLESHTGVSASSGRDVLFEDKRYHAGLGDDRVLRGLVWHSQASDGLGHVFRSEANDWLACKVGGNDDPLLRRAATTASRSFVEDGVVVPIEITTTFDLDSECRTTTERRAGTGLVGDERIIERSYVSDDTSWVRDRICQETVYEWDGVTIRSNTLTAYGSDTAQYGWCGDRLGNGWIRQVAVQVPDAPGTLMADRLETVKQIAYDAVGNPIRASEAGATRDIQYDADRLYPLTETLHPTPTQDLSWHITWDPLLGLPATMRDPNGDVRSMGYDALSRPTALSLNGAAPHATYAYDWTPPTPRTMTSLIDHASASACLPNRQTVAVDNALGEPLYTSTAIGPGEWIISGWKERDERGKVVLAAEPFTSNVAYPSARAGTARVQTVDFDALGRLTLQTLSNGARKIVSYQGLCQTVSNDELADVESCVDGLGRTAHTERTVAGLRETVDAQYDAADHILEMVLQKGMPDETTHSFTYDLWGHIKTTNDPDTGPRSLSYDEVGVLRSHTNGMGETIFFDYDGAGRLIRRGEGPTPNPLTDYVYAYDAPAAGMSGACRAGARLASVVEQASGQVSFCYDAFGRQSRMARTIVSPGGLRTASAESVFTPSGLLASEAFDDGFEAEYCYDGAGRANSISFGGAVVWSAAGADDLDASGRVTHEQYGNGASETYTYDALGLTKSIDLRSTVGGQLVDLFKVDVTRTAFGAPKTIDDGDGNDDSLDHSATYTYDQAARLTRATLGKGDDSPGQYVFSFGYDGLQNMTFRQVMQGTTPKDIGVLTGNYRYGERGYGPRQLTSVLPGAAP